MVTSDLKSLLLPVYDRINCIIGTKWLKNKNCQTNFFELFPPEGDQMFEQIVQGSWIISILGDFQIVRQVLEPPSLTGPAFETEVLLQISRGPDQTRFIL